MQWNRVTRSHLRAVTLALLNINLLFMGSFYLRRDAFRVLRNCIQCERRGSKLQESKETKNNTTYPPRTPIKVLEIIPHAQRQSRGLLRRRRKPIRPSVANIFDPATTGFDASLIILLHPTVPRPHICMTISMMSWRSIARLVALGMSPWWMALNARLSCVIASPLPSWIFSSSHPPDDRTSS